MRTIETLGGPFVCIERRLAHLWQGMDGSSVGSVFDDYYRTEEVEGWFGDMTVGDNHRCLVFLGPFFTGVWKDSLGRPVVVRTLAFEPDLAEEPVLDSLEPIEPDNRVESRQVTFHSSEIILFDSVYPGTKIGPEFLTFNVEPGTYRVDVVEKAIDDVASLVLHPFTFLSSA